MKADFLFLFFLYKNDKNDLHFQFLISNCNLTFFQQIIIAELKYFNFYENNISEFVLDQQTLIILTF